MQTLSEYEKQRKRQTEHRKYGNIALSKILFTEGKCKEKCDSKPKI